MSDGAIHFDEGTGLFTDPLKPGWSVRVTAAHFVAGFEVEDNGKGGRVTRAAPILAWVKSQPTARAAVVACRASGYKVEICPNGTIAIANSETGGGTGQADSAKPADGGTPSPNAPPTNPPPPPPPPG